jgi:hypothetical protein
MLHELQVNVACVAGEYTSTPVGAVEGLAPGERIYSVTKASFQALLRRS